jgi:hypothetical protein
MPFYLKKSVSFGPIRFNLSKSGIGVSAGIKGFRVGSGPRGNYVHVGRGGLYYRSSLPSGRTPYAPGASPDSEKPSVPSAENLREIESGDVLKMVDSSSRALLEELNEKLAAASTFPWVVISFACLMAYLLFGSLQSWIIWVGPVPSWVVWLTGIFGVFCATTSYHYDGVKRSTVIMFDLDSEAESKFRELHEAFHQLALAEKVWNVEAAGTVVNTRYNAGATSAVKRSVVRLATDTPPNVRTNIPVAMIPAGRQKLYLFPDKLLVFESNGIGAVGYRDLNIEISQERIVEQAAIPSDANVVGQTWKYVNKSGGPDRRFKDNRELPVVLYETIHLKSSSGLNELFQVSKVGLGNRFRTALQALASA